MGAFRAPARARGFDNALVRAFPNITNVDMLGHHQPGAARARPGDPRGGVPVRLHAGRRAGGAVRRGHRHARGARARVRDHARGGRAARCCARCSARSWSASALLAGFLASVGRRSAVGWALARYAFDFDWTASPLGAAGRRAGRRGAGAGGGLVGPARGAASAGGGNAAARGAGVGPGRRARRAARPVGRHAPQPDAGARGARGPMTSHAAPRPGEMARGAAP